VSPNARNLTGHDARLTPSHHSAGLLTVKPLLEMIGHWRDFLPGGVSEEKRERIRHHDRTGRPFGNDGFVGKLEDPLGRNVQRRKPGRKRELREN
jgi:hypothetical protein